MQISALKGLLVIGTLLFATTPQALDARTVDDTRQALSCCEEGGGCKSKTEKSESGCKSKNDKISQASGTEGGGGTEGGTGAGGGEGTKTSGEGDSGGTPGTAATPSGGTEEAAGEGGTGGEGGTTPAGEPEGGK